MDEEILAYATLGKAFWQRETGQADMQVAIQRLNALHTQRQQAEAKEQVIQQALAEDVAKRRAKRKKPAEVSP